MSIEHVFSIHLKRPFVGLDVLAKQPSSQQTFAFGSRSDHCFCTVFTVWYCVKKKMLHFPLHSACERVNKRVTECVSVKEFQLTFLPSIYILFFFASCASFLAHFFFSRRLYAFSPATVRCCCSFLLSSLLPLSLLLLLLLVFTRIETYACIFYVRSHSK